MMRSGLLRMPFVITVFASLATAQLITPRPGCAVPPFPKPTPAGHGYAVYPTKPMPYPKVSNRYKVQYNLGTGGWNTATVYVSYYGGTNSSPRLNYSGYTQGTTSLSFVSIPVGTSPGVQLQVTKLWGEDFPASVSARPSAKGITINSVSGKTVQLSTKIPTTTPRFDGEQFILWWQMPPHPGKTHERTPPHHVSHPVVPAEGGDIEGLVFFLNPTYAPPTSKVKVISSNDDLQDDLSKFQALDIEGQVTIAAPGSIEKAGAQAFTVPPNITTIYLGPPAWVQGKLLFTPNSSKQRHIYGPGVLDASLFEYDLRLCPAPPPGSTEPNYAEQGYPVLNALDAKGNFAPIDNLWLDGIIITDNNYYATGLLTHSIVNNVKVIGWNGNNDGLESGKKTQVSNVFVRCGDDSLKMWGRSDTVTNATVWQNYNGGVVNLGWFDNSPGGYGSIDGLYVVKTDWFTPRSIPSSSLEAVATDPVNHQNNAIITSMMVPGTKFGNSHAPAYGNIYVEDPPQVLFSLKILPPRPINSKVTCKVSLDSSSVLNLNIQNLFTPASTVPNSIGFQTVPSGFDFCGKTSSASNVLTGTMSISLSNVVITPPGGTGTVLTATNLVSTGNLDIQPAPTITTTSTAVVININSFGPTVTKPPSPVPNPGEKLNSQPGVFQTVRELPADQQENSLSSNRRFQAMPPERQQQIRELLQKWNSWTPDQKSQQRDVEEILRSTSPDHHEATRGYFPAYRRLSAVRRQAVLEAFRHVRELPPDQRGSFLSDPQTHQQFSSQELDVLKGLTKHLTTSP